MSSVGSISGVAGMGSGMTEEQVPFSAQMKDAGQELHQAVEQTPIAKAMFQATVAESEYIDYLAGLREIYEQLEAELVVNQDAGFIKPLLVPGLFRTDYIKKDLIAFDAEGHEAHSLAKDYKAHLLYLGQQQPHRLIAHAYLRYLGDLFGGMMIARKLKGSFEGKLNFYDFSEMCSELQIRAPQLFAKQFREILDNLPLNEAQKADVLEEVETGYQMHQKLFEALKA